MHGTEEARKSIGHYRKQEFCRQPKLTANIRKADGKASNQLSARQSAVLYFSVSLESTDGKVFAVSHFGQADGNASRTVSP